jgi:hypothetical protein
VCPPPLLYSGKKIWGNNFPTVFQTSKESKKKRFLFFFEGEMSSNTKGKRRKYHKIENAQRFFFFLG